MRRAKLLGALTAALLLSAGAVHAASPLEKNALLGSPDGDYVLKADDVTYDVKGKVVTATGHVEVDHNGRIVTADLLTYDQDADTVTASGSR